PHPGWRPSPRSALQSAPRSSLRWLPLLARRSAPPPAGWAPRQCPPQTLPPLPAAAGRRPPAPAARRSAARPTTNASCPSTCSSPLLHSGSQCSGRVDPTLRSRAGPGSMGEEIEGGNKNREPCGSRECQSVRAERKIAAEHPVAGRARAAARWFDRHADGAVIHDGADCGQPDYGIAVLAYREDAAAV